MNILYLFAAIIAVLAGFIGLIVIIKGFVDKSNKNIKLGTILVSIGLILALSGGYCVAHRAVKMVKHHAWYRDQMMQKGMMNCDFDMMEGGGKCDSMSKDTNCMKKCTKIMIEKNCGEKKCDGKCKHDIH